MPYTQLFYHIVWATKNREPLVTPKVEPMIYDLLRSKASGLGGVVFALNGMPEHVHLVTTIPAKIAVATFVGQVKGVASTRFNKSGTRAEPLFWQEGYGAFTFDAKRLPSYIAYVERQKEHHAQGSVIPVLERTDDFSVQMLRAAPASYMVEDSAWRAEYGSAKPGLSRGTPARFTGRCSLAGSIYGPARSHEGKRRLIIRTMHHFHRPLEISHACTLLAQPQPH